MWKSTSHWSLRSYGICYGSQGPIRNSPAHLSIWRSCLLLVSSCVTKWPYHLDIYGKMLLVILICLQTLRKWPYRNQSGSVVRNTHCTSRELSLLGSQHPYWVPPEQLCLQLQRIWNVLLSSSGTHVHMTYVHKKTHTKEIPIVCFMFKLTDRSGLSPLFTSLFSFIFYFFTYLYVWRWVHMPQHIGHRS